MADTISHVGLFQSVRERDPVNPEITGNRLKGNPWFTVPCDLGNIQEKLSWISIGFEKHPSSRPSGLATLDAP